MQLLHNEIKSLNEVETNPERKIKLAWKVLIHIFQVTLVPWWYWKSWMSIFISKWFLKTINDLIKPTKISENLSAGKESPYFNFKIYYAVTNHCALDWLCSSFLYYINIQMSWCASRPSFEYSVKLHYRICGWWWDIRHRHHSTLCIPVSWKANCSSKLMSSAPTLSVWG